MYRRIQATYVSSVRRLKWRARRAARAVEEAGRWRRSGFTDKRERPFPTEYGRIPKGGRLLGGNHRQFPGLSRIIGRARRAQRDHPKSWDGTLWASGERPSTRVARTETTPSCCCTIPSTRRNGSVTTGRRWAAKRCGVAVTFAIPVSSSRERKTNPLAGPRPR